VSVAIRGVHGDIEPGKAHQLIRAGKPAGIADLRPDDRRAQPPDAVVALQRLTAGLVSGEVHQLGAQWLNLGAELINAS
jgi:hypothetical protein